MARKLIVEIVGDASSLEKAFKQADQGTSKFGRHFGTIAKGAGIAALGIGAGVAFGLKKAVESANDHAVALAQTRAVLKSTGGVANVTAKQITGLADSIEKTTGVDDLAIQRGENLLATFTNIRNETGKGNDVFTRATKTIADMSVALGQDTKASAIQLGKALNDPIKGVTALRRVGVSFTADQLKQIKSLVASGKTLDAQKLILRELTKEFGGSAKAAGQTLPGQLNILKARLDDVAQKVGEKLVPALTRIVTWVSDHWPQISAVIERTFQEIAKAWDRLQPILRAVFQALERTVEFVQRNWPEIQRVVAKVAEDIRIVWAKVGPTLTAVFKVAVATIVPLIKSIAAIVKGVAQVIDGILHGKWSEVWDGIKNVVTGAFHAIKTLLVAQVKIFAIYGKAIGGALKDALVGALKGFGTLIARIVLFPINKIIDAINSIKIGAVKVAGRTITPAFDPIPNIPRIGLGGDVVHVTNIDLDGKRIASVVEKHQQRAQRRTSAQRTGRIAGIGPVVG